MKTKKKARTWLLVPLFAFIFLMAGQGAYAEDPVDPAPPEEEPAFQNPAQAAHAENLADASAAKAEAEAAAATKEAEEREADLAAAQDTVDNLPSDATAEEIAAAQAALDAAQDAYDLAAEVAEQKTAEIGGTSVEEIAEMRDSGMGWGEIAHELGIHPGVLGLGHTKRHRWKNQVEGELGGEIGEATERNLKTGLAKGHGAKGDKGQNGNSAGFGKANAPGQNKDKAKGNPGKGNSGKGNSGKGNNK
jgi:hypothetical protein